MKVRIITVYNSLNPGSFLQATSLYNAIEKMGYDVAFYDTGIRKLRKQAYIDCFYLLKRGRFGNIPKKLKIVKQYEEVLANYKVVTEVDNDRDAFVLGSDEIWNVERPKMAKFPILWGEGLNYDRTISYAPSLNNADADTVRSKDFAMKVLEKLHAISVRDNHSYDELKQLTDREIIEVCDPTVLVYPDGYESVPDTCDIQDYIFVYIYHNTIGQEEIDEIKAFAKKKNKKLVAFGAAQSWCDINVNGSPMDFLKYIKNADYTCTSTFHGTMLSIILAKQFVVMGHKNKKVQQLLDTLGLDRHASGSSVETVLETEYDKEAVKQKLMSMRDAGLSYLKQNFEDIEK